MTRDERRAAFEKARAYILAAAGRALQATRTPEELFAAEDILGDLREAIGFLEPVAADDETRGPVFSTDPEDES